MSTSSVAGTLVLGLSKGCHLSFGCSSSQAVASRGDSQQYGISLDLGTLGRPQAVDGDREPFASGPLAQVPFLRIQPDFNLCLLSI